MDFEKLNLNRDDILYFLNCGYFANYENKCYSIDFNNIDKRLYSNRSLGELVYLGSNILEKSIQKRVSPGNCLVPLSGGLDSRLILGFLMKIIPSENIKTVTFGIPGTYDFEIGNYIAKKLKTNHLSINLNDYPPSKKDLFTDSKAMQSQCYLFCNPPLRILYEKYSDHKMWSGFIGDLVSGGFHHYNNCDSVEEAIRSSFNSDKISKSISLENPSNEYLIKNGSFKSVSKDKMPYFVQAFYHNHVAKLTYPNIIFKDFEFELPFIDKTWFKFINSVDDNYLINQKLYRLICIKTFPELFSYPCKNMSGLSIRNGMISTTLSNSYSRINRKFSKYYLTRSKRLNYRDNDWEFRYNKSLRELLKEMLSDFNLRYFGIELDIHDLLRQQSQGFLHSRIIINLLSLKINLEVKFGKYK